MGSFWMGEFCSFPQGVEACHVSVGCNLVYMSYPVISLVFINWLIYEGALHWLPLEIGAQGSYITQMTGRSPRRRQWCLENGKESTWMFGWIGHMCIPVVWTQHLLSALPYSLFFSCSLLSLPISSHYHQNSEIPKHCTTRYLFSDTWWMS